MHSLTSVITANNLSKTYTYHTKSAGVIGSLRSLVVRKKMYANAVADVSFDIHAGEFVGFLGPNGAGKTTTLKMLAGIIEPTSGELTVLGHTPWQRKKEFQKRFSLVMGQKNQLWWDLPPQESFTLNKAIYEVGDSAYKKNLKELVDLLDIHDILDIQVRKLSLGQRMKAELVASLLHRPELVLLDEPTIGLDVVAQKNIRDFLRDYNRRYGNTIILTSHYTEDIKQLAQRTIIIDRGNIIFDGSFRELTNTYAKEKFLEVILEKPVEKKTLDRYGAIQTFAPDRVVFRVERHRIRKTAADILASDLPVEDINIQDLPVDDLIRDVFQLSSQNR